MSYARPMGDYGQRPQGGWADVWGGFKEAAKVVIGGAIGGWLGGGGYGESTQPVGRGGPIMVPPAPPSVPGTFGGQITFPGGMGIGGQFLVPGQGRLPPFTATGPGVLPYGGRGGGMVPSGYHYAKDGSQRIVRNRRMNIANPRALRRAMRRVQGFEKLAKRTISFTRRVRMKKRKSS